MKILGIDPGITHLGAAVIELDIENKNPFQLLYADSYRGELNDFDLRPDVPNQTKAKGLLRSFEYLVNRFEPDVIIVEDNFLGGGRFGLSSNPASFKRLIEVVTMMSFLVHREKPGIPFHTVLPRLAKQIVGADFSGSTKDDVTIGLKQYDFLHLNQINLDNLTEHANDAILIALYECVQIYQSLQWLDKNANVRKEEHDS